MGAASTAVLLGTLVLAYTPLHGPICLSRTLLHMPCPGCGLTRSMSAIWRGEILLSLRYHPIGLPLFLACLWGVVRALLRTPFHGILAQFESLAERFARPSSATLVFAFMVALWAVRMGLWYSGSRLFLW